MRTEQVTLTNMCMVYDDNGNVLVQDKVDSDWGGLTFPGGHIEKGESFVGLPFICYLCNAIINIRL